MILRQYIGSWITTFRLARKYGIAGATDLCKKEMFLKRRDTSKLWAISGKTGISPGWENERAFYLRVQILPAGEPGNPFWILSAISNVQPAGRSLISNPGRKILNQPFPLIDRPRRRKTITKTGKRGDRKCTKYSDGPGGGE